jgi:hypothetical protein
MLEVVVASPFRIPDASQKLTLVIVWDSTRQGNPLAQVANRLRPVSIGSGCAIFSRTGILPSQNRASCSECLAKDARLFLCTSGPKERFGGLAATRRKRTSKMLRNPGKPVALMSSAALIVLVTGAAAQPQGKVGQYSDVTIEGSVLEPEKIEVTDDAEVAGLIKAPDGFKVEVFARDLVKPAHAGDFGSRHPLCDAAQRRRCRDGEGRG